VNSSLSQAPGAAAGAPRVVHVQARDGRDRPGVAAGAQSWFTCGRGCAVPDASA
jgi:hypothetical protein